MEKPSPLNTVKNLIEAINQGDLDAALSFYEPQAVLVAQPGNIARERDAIRAALLGFVSLKPSLKGEAHQVVEAGDLALYSSRWTLVGTSPEGKRVEMNGISSDVLRRHPDGRWLVAVDNPWGTSIVG
ncbi:MAG TPA: nuclear transport factor 2 family protein [Nitrososphaera sp.]|jgi:uncharacterized protein (TIGR02246 family)|nr:nuclear transport factor 2 family protein [Nitrososphaera sp.]